MGLAEDAAASCRDALARRGPREDPELSYWLGVALAMDAASVEEGDPPNLDGWQEAADAFTAALRSPARARQARLGRAHALDKLARWPELVETIAPLLEDDGADALTRDLAREMLRRAEPLATLRTRSPAWSWSAADPTGPELICTNAAKVERRADGIRILSTAETHGDFVGFPVSYEGGPIRLVFRVRVDGPIGWGTNTGFGLQRLPSENDWDGRFQGPIAGLFFTATGANDRPLRAASLLRKPIDQRTGWVFGSFGEAEVVDLADRECEVVVELAGTDDRVTAVLIDVATGEELARRATSLTHRLIRGSYLVGSVGLTETGTIKDGRRGPYMKPTAVVWHGLDVVTNGKSDASPIALAGRRHPWRKLVALGGRFAAGQDVTADLEALLRQRPARRGKLGARAFFLQALALSRRDAPADEISRAARAARDADPKEAELLLNGLELIGRREPAIERAIRGKQD